MSLAPQAVADTTTYHHARQTFHSFVPCVGPATMTTVINAIIHTSPSPGGGFHENDTTTGTFTAVLDAGSTDSGHFMIMSVYETADNVTYNGTFEFNGQVTGGVGAGTSWHENAFFRAPTDPAGTPQVAFDDFHCS